MNLTTRIINAKVPGYQNLQQILIDSTGKIKQIISQTEELLPTASTTIDVQQDWVSLGGFDLQINGALGLAFPEVDANSTTKIQEICQYLWQQGIDAFLPTIVTTSIDNIQRSLQIFHNFASQPQDPEMAKIWGVHLEGPFLNPEKRGAHPLEYLLPLTLKNVKEVLGEYAEIVKIITLAPELDSTETVIPYLKNLGITVSLGHSQATANEAEKAFKLGASMVTHAFNAMPSLHHRKPGLLGAAITNSDVMCGLIADGQHVCSTMIEILLKASQYRQGIFLVSDALSPLGLPDGIYPWDTREIEVKNGTARLKDGTLSGTTLPLLVGVNNLVKWGICDIETGIYLATIAPRKALGIDSEIIGKSGKNLLRWRVTKSEVRSQKRCDPATTPVARERAPRESEVIFVTRI
ncbi:MAG: N-acetylglucosamine-6-phosphate deacetylase [Okeania sp. SIO2G4]|uniref:N-acetylglucosamine-6-phosphate deacetylase n=1 Tax=unclassified Okeania TaxID=2634635 RepID=UPI0013BCB36F|nr:MULTISPECIES: N-acetylglucosamine-6-phosphate deacetylase [unclassified Okeania]NEP05787.1 N-acetylglucosamine-6-phosphate deacetylase [Okeania sp. SIO4D6]NEP71786.1 N-acetylglucosamine-6-phosphate deacetylase [Okeania sp. SIO2G5]NEP92442.1 N-acetylglucosamine-6-phosphate deacetylase [Okeania sp. SIO2F5]NEQ90486.1 N-acetylglucosamine-6-phosphate deacetylase [Okeania sp. SIO2G4]